MENRLWVLSVYIFYGKILEINKEMLFGSIRYELPLRRVSKRMDFNAWGPFLESPRKF